MVPLLNTVSSAQVEPRKMTEAARTQDRMVYMETLFATSKHRNTASHAMYDRRRTLLRSAAPEVSYISTLAGPESYVRSAMYTS